MSAAHIGVFTYQPTNYDCITRTKNSKSRCEADNENLIDKHSWSIIIEEQYLNSVDKIDKLIPEGHSLPRLYSVRFCKPTLKHPNTIVWLPEEMCLIIHNSDFLVGMSKLKNPFLF